MAPASAGRPYRHEIGRTITAAAIRALGVEAISDLVDARAAARTGTAATADLLDRARAVIDDRIDIAVRGGVTEADQHGF